mgnify:CR=1 FL=1
MFLFHGTAADEAAVLFIPLPKTWLHCRQVRLCISYKTTILFQPLFLRMLTYNIVLIYKAPGFLSCDPQKWYLL